MIKIDHTEVVGWEPAIRGMRNPKNSWGKLDSEPCRVIGEITPENAKWRCAGCKLEYLHGDHFVIGPNDHGLMMRLRNAGTDHRKYLRMIAVYADITAPLYWWKEFDTYKVGTVANSCSTMHKIAAKEFMMDDFSHEHLSDSNMCWLEDTIDRLNFWRGKYLSYPERGHEVEEDDGWYMPKKDVWWQMIQLLPSSYNQKRTVMLNYEVLANQCHSRLHHKLDEWREYCKWVESLPYSELITGDVKSHD